MKRLADAIVLMWGWRRLLLAFAAGAANALTLAPFDLFPVGWVTIPILVWLIDGAAGREGAGFIRRLLPAAAIGWCFGFGYFLAGLWWIGLSFLVDGDRFAALLPFAVLVLPAGLALLWAVGVALARLFWSDGWPRILVLAIVMTLVEWIRGHALTGFPWNAFGYALMPRPEAMQIASAVGLWGVTLLAFLVFAAPVLLVRDRAQGSGRIVTFGAIVLLLVGDLGYGVLRLQGADGAVVPGVRLRIVQAAIPQREKDDPAAWAAAFRRHLELSAEPATVPITHLIWPETAIPYLLTESPAELAAIARLLEPGTTLIAGAPRTGPVRPDGARAVTNSVLVINDRGEIVDSYDKVHLVPFGEYLPFKETLERWGLRQMIALPGGFAAGVERRLLRTPGAPPLAPLVCYEAIFPGEVTPEGERPGWLVNVTNDAWYGASPGLPQGLRQAALRAVEEGLPLIRAANTGISAIIDPYGRILSQLAISQSGVIDGDLPQSLSVTPYALKRDLIPAVLLVILGVVATIGRVTRRQRSI